MYRTYVKKNLNLNSWIINIYGELEYNLTNVGAFIIKQRFSRHFHVSPFFFSFLLHFKIRNNSISSFRVILKKKKMIVRKVHNEFIIIYYSCTRRCNRIESKSYVNRKARSSLWNIGKICRYFTKYIKKMLIQRKVRILRRLLKV